MEANNSQAQPLTILLLGTPSQEHVELVQNTISNLPSQAIAYIAESGISFAATKQTTDAYAEIDSTTQEVESSHNITSGVFQAEKLMAHASEYALTTDGNGIATYSKISPEKTKNVIAHELGHALSFAIRNGYAPLEGPNSESYKAAYEKDIQKMGGPKAVAQRGYSYYINISPEKGREELFAETFANAAGLSEAFFFEKSWPNTSAWMKKTIHKLEKDWVNDPQSLHKAAFSNDEKLFDDLLAQDHDINEKTINNLSCLDIAIQRNSTTIALKALDHPAIDTSGRVDGMTALERTAKKDKQPIFEKLLAHASTTEEEIENTLFRAVENNEIEIVKTILNNPKLFDINATEIFSTPLSIAAEKGHHEIATLLLAHPDIDPTAGDPIEAARDAGHTKTANLIQAFILSKEKDPSKPNSQILKSLTQTPTIKPVKKQPSRQFGF